MVESGLVPKTIESGRVPKIVRTSTEKWKNQGQYRKMIAFGRVPRKGRIRARTEKLSERVPKNGRISVTTEKW